MRNRHVSAKTTPIGQSAASERQPTKGHALISAGTLIEGKIIGARQVEVAGEIRGEIGTDHLIVREGGRIFGTTKAKSAEIAGTAEGELHITDLCNIKSTGEVAGDIRYGRLAMAEGANLEANLKNIPPELGGDFEITIQRGGMGRITTADLTAFDPDDKPVDLTFTVSNIKGGHLARRSAPQQALNRFTQADLETGDIAFIGHPSASGDGAFDVVVTDASGATSGPARTVTVKVTA